MLSRRFKRLPRSMQQRLADEFSALNAVVRSDEVVGFKHLAVSVFDHWLSAEEAGAQMSAPHREVQEERNNRLHAFACDLATGAESFLVKWVGRHKSEPTFRGFLNQPARSECLRPAPYNAGERQRFVLVFPDLHAIYMEGCDFTHHIYLREPGRAEPVFDAARKAGLYVLE